MPSFTPVNAVLRGIEVLNAVSKLKRARVGDIFKLTRINRPTIVRMLETLEYGGYVLCDREQRVYMPTGKTIELSSGYDLHREVGVVAGPILTELRQAVGWPSDVGVFDGDAMIVAETSRNEGRLFNRRPGYRAPVLATSLGLAYLAFCKDEDRARAIDFASRSGEPWNTYLLANDRIHGVLGDIRRSGYAAMNDEYSRREYQDLALAIGVPVLFDGSAVASINLMFLRDAVSKDEVVARFLAPLTATAAKISSALSAVRKKAEG